MFLVCNQFTLIASVNEFALLVRNLFGILVR